MCMGNKCSGPALCRFLFLTTNTQMAAKIKIKTKAAATAIPAIALAPSDAAADDVVAADVDADVLLPGQ